MDQEVEDKEGGEGEGGGGGGGGETTPREVNTIVLATRIEDFMSGEIGVFKQEVKFWYIKFFSLYPTTLVGD